MKLHKLKTNTMKSRSGLNQTKPCEMQVNTNHNRLIAKNYKILNAKHAVRCVTVEVRVCLDLQMTADYQPTPTCYRLKMQTVDHKSRTAHDFEAKSHKIDTKTTLLRTNLSWKCRFLRTHSK